MIHPPLSTVILAAGKGTRMKSNKAKVLHQAFYQPMVTHVIESASTLDPVQTLVVIGHQKDAVRAALTSTGCDFSVQAEQLGTGHAVLSTEKLISATAQNILILCGDTPLILPETLQQLYAFHAKKENDITLLTTNLEAPFGYGRILCNNEGNIQAIVEEKDATSEQRKITEVNAGIYCVKKEFLFSALQKVGTNNKQGEMYLTDIIAIGVQSGKSVRPFNINDPIEVLGVNSRQELAKAEQELQMRRNRELMASGISMICPETIRVSPESQLDPDTILEPSTHIHGATTIKSACHIEHGSVLYNCELGENVTIGAGSYLANTSLPEGTTLPPHSCQS